MSRTSLVVVLILAIAIFICAYDYYFVLEPRRLVIEDEYSLVPPRPVVVNWSYGSAYGEISDDNGLQKLIGTFGIRPRPINLVRSRLLYCYERKLTVDDREPLESERRAPNLIFVYTGLEKKEYEGKCYFVQIRRIKKPVKWF